MAEKMANEKRRHERKPTSVGVEVVANGKVDKNKARDVSLCGMFIRNEDSSGYDLNQDIVLAFESKSGQAHAVEATVVRKDEKGIGIRFKKELIAIALEHAQEWLPVSEKQ